MKKQIDEKSSKKNFGQKSSRDKKGNSLQCQMTEDEKQKLAKEESSKNISYHNQEMIKRLILKNIMNYTAIIAVLVIFIIGVIKIAPALLNFLNGLIYKLFIGSLKQ